MVLVGRFQLLFWAGGCFDVQSWSEGLGGFMEAFQL